MSLGISSGLFMLIYNVSFHFHSQKFSLVLRKDFGLKVWLKKSNLFLDNLLFYSQKKFVACFKRELWKFQKRITLNSQLI